MEDESEICIVDKRAFIELVKRYETGDNSAAMCTDMIRLVMSDPKWLPSFERAVQINYELKDYIRPEFPKNVHVKNDSERGASWWDVFTSKLKESTRNPMLVGDVQYIFSETHQVWHMSNEDPQVIKEKTNSAHVEPPPTTPLDISARKRTRYVDMLGITADEKKEGIKI